MGQQKLSIETSNNSPIVGQQITVDIFHEVEREATESGAIKLSLSLFFNDNELQLDSIDYPSSSFNKSFEATLGDSNNDDSSDETNKRTAISFQQGSLFAPYPDEKTKIATATFTVLENFDGSEVSVKIPSSTSQTYNNAPPEVFEPKTITLELEVPNTAPVLTGTPATLTNGTEDTDYTLNASDLLQGFTDINGDDLSVTELQATQGSLIDNNNGTWTFTPNSDFNGTVDLTYNVSDGKGGITPATQSFTVNPVDDLPVVQNALADITVDEDANNTVIDLSNVFTDLDGDAIALSVFNNSNDSLVTATLDGNNLTLDYLPNQSGTAEITIQGTANGQTVEDTFTVNVNPVDDLPVVQNAIADVNVDEDAPNTVIDLSNVFTDLDGDAIALSVFNNSNDSLVTATLDGNNLTLDYLPNQSGTAEITIQGTANGQTVEDTFTVNVNPVDDLPVVQNAIVDVNVDEDAPNTVIDLSNVFTDVDGEAIALSVFNNSNDSLVTATIDGNNLTLDYLPNQSGTAEITIQGTSNGQSVEDTFTVNVNPVDDLPVVSNPIADIMVEQNAENQTLDLSNVFSDADGDEITLTVKSNSNDSLVITTLDGSNLTLNYVDNRSGTAEITIEATANGQTVEDTFTVTVNEIVAPPNTPPSLENPLADVTATEDSEFSLVIPENTFNDVDAGDSLTYSASLEDGSELPSWLTFDAATRTFSGTPNNSDVGTLNVKVTAIDNVGEEISDIFVLTVENVDDAPIVSNELTDVTVDEDAPNTVIDLSNVFTDLDGEAIALSVFNNSNDSLVTAMLDGNNLSLDYLPNQSGTAEITIQGTSNGKTIEDTFTVTVNPVDDAPVLENAIADVTVDEDAENTVIDISDLFTDIDNDDNAIALRVSDNSNESLVTATINGNNLTLDYQDNQSGTAAITIQGEANGETVEDTFTVTVNPIDDLPVVENALADVTVEEDAENTLIDISDLFTDIDNDNNAIALRVSDNSNESLVTATINGNNLTLDYQDNQSGTAAITIQGTSNGQTVKDTFTVNVNSLNQTILGDVDNNYLTGSERSDTIDGNAGNDTIFGGLNNDSILGGEGDDLLFGLEDNDFIAGNNGRDIMTGNQGSDSLFGGEGDDTIYGNQDNDILNGGLGDDILNGGLGDDILNGNEGSDILLGGEGSDIFVIELGQQRDIIMDFTDGLDRIGLSNGITFEDLTVVDDNNTLIKDKNNQAIAVFLGVDASAISADDFVTI
jgi:hypothetical protein